MTFLIDTNVISAVAPTKKERPTALVDWINRSSDQIYVSAITATEIRDGIAKAAREGATRKASILNAWWGRIEYLYGERILAFDLRVATIAGAITNVARAAGQAPGFAAVAIAATAQAYGLTLLTRNRRHFVGLCESILDPFESPPSL